jgi:hypothetical protein
MLIVMTLFCNIQRLHYRVYTIMIRFFRYFSCDPSWSIGAHIEYLGEELRLKVEVVWVFLTCGLKILDNTRTSVVKKVKFGQLYLLIES